ncbi:hypothetical protein SLEP1_g19274 [Rubroshorea leprosula]|nr:hypothetical protein SLEP1_g19274 [Rubroshorea leprosula]
MVAMTNSFIPNILTILSKVAYLPVEIQSDVTEKALTSLAKDDLIQFEAIYPHPFPLAYGSNDQLFHPQHLNNPLKVIQILLPLTNGNNDQLFHLNILTILSKVADLPVDIQLDVTEKALVSLAKDDLIQFEAMFYRLHEDQALMPDMIHPSLPSMNITSFSYEGTLIELVNEPAFIHTLLPLANGSNDQLFHPQHLDNPLKDQALMPDMIHPKYLYMTVLKPLLYSFLEPLFTTLRCALANHRIVIELDVPYLKEILGLNEPVPKAQLDAS